MTIGPNEGSPPEEAYRRMVGGSIKEALGKITGDAATEREGAAEKAGTDCADAPKAAR